MSEAEPVGLRADRLQPLLREIHAECTATLAPVRMQLALLEVSWLERRPDPAAPPAKRAGFWLRLWRWLFPPEPATREVKVVVRLRTRLRGLPRVSAWVRPPPKPAPPPRRPGLAFWKRRTP